MKKLFFVICLAMGAYKAYSDWEERKAMQEYLDFEASRPKDRSDSKAGFIEAIVPEGVSPTVMTVFMPVGCPMEEGRRGRALIEKMKAANIPVTASSNANVQIRAQTQAEFDAKMALMNKVTTGGTPIVFFKGRAKNNPSFKDVMVEFQTAQ